MHPSDISSDEFPAPRCRYHSKLLWETSRSTISDQPSTGWARLTAGWIMMVGRATLFGRGDMGVDSLSVAVKSKVRLDGYWKNEYSIVV